MSSAEPAVRDLSLTATEADRDLVRRDPGLPPLAVLLDDGAATAWLRRHVGDDVVLRRRYLRYKAGTSCLVAAELRTEHGVRDVVLAGYAPAASSKLEKTVAQAPPGAVVAADPGLGLLATTPVADRQLPALRALGAPEERARLACRLLSLSRTPEAEDVTLTRLSYKPHRRWVGLLRVADRAAVLRCYRPGDPAPALAAAAALADARVETQRVLGVDHRRGLLALEFVPGRTLEHRHDDSALRAAGRALGHLHAHAVDLGGEPGDEPLALRRSARLIDALLPPLAPTVDEIVERVSGRLADDLGLGQGGVGTVHGDFSLDQVVGGPSGPTLIDLDRAARGATASDFGSLAAASLVAGRPLSADAAGSFRRGYAEVLDVPPDDDVATWTAAHLVRRMAEPFRTCRPDWPVETGRLADLAARALDGRTP